MRKYFLLLMIIGCMMFTSCNLKQITKDYPSLQNTHNITKYVTIDDVFQLFQNNDNQKYIIVFGFKSCQWCHAAIGIINDIAIEKNYSQVNYLDIKVMRDDPSSKLHDQYLKLYNMIKDEIGNPSQIIVPTVIVIKNGLVEGFHTGTTEGHDKIDGNLPPMTIEQTNELKDIYRSFF